MYFYRDQSHHGLSHETENPEDAGAAARAAMGGAQPGGDSHADEGDPDLASAADGKPTQGGPNSTSKTGQQQKGASQPSAGSEQAKQAPESAKGEGTNAGQSMQGTADKIQQQLQGQLPQDSEGHLNNAKDAANSAVSISNFWYLTHLNSSSYIAVLPFDALLTDFL